VITVHWYSNSATCKSCIWFGAVRVLKGGGGKKH
jgi:hypothetical protein